MGIRGRLTRAGPTPRPGVTRAHPMEPPPAASDHVEAPTALLLCLPFWFCDRGRRSATRKAPACAGSCTWWHTRSPASGTLGEWVLAAIRAHGAAHQQRSRVDSSSPATVLQRQRRTTYKNPSTPLQRHTKSFNNRLRTERLEPHPLDQPPQAPLMKPLQPPHHHRHTLPTGLPAPADYVPEASRPPTRRAAQSTESR